MADRFVVTGCGRSGTKYTSQLLTAAGVPCGHELAHSHQRRGQWPHGLTADASWMAATMLELVDAPVVLLVRHPLAVVASWAEIGFFGRDLANPTHGPLRGFAPEVYDRPEHDRALAMWCVLTEAALARAELVLRLERLAAGPGPLRRLLRWSGAESAGAERAHRQIGRVNRHEPSRRATGVTWTPSWQPHEPMLATRARSLARAFGYDPEEVPGG